MEKFLIPLSFTNRRAPFVGKVIADAERMYAHARYVIVTDENGNVTESRKNRRADDNIVDCLAVFAPVTYLGKDIERSVVLEIGFRRFIPYVEAEYYPNASKRRGPVVRLRKGEERRKVVPPPKSNKKRVIISGRVRVARLSDAAMLNLMEELTFGIQECVDDIMRLWENTPVQQRRGTNRHGENREYDHEHSVVIHLPMDEVLLCASAHFAELDWRTKSNRQLDAIASGLKRKLQYYTRPGAFPTERFDDGSYDDDFIKKSTQLYYVAEKISRRVEFSGYSKRLVEELLDLIGNLESPERKLVEQVLRVHKNRIKEPSDTALEERIAPYEYLRKEIATKWKLRNYRSIRLEKRKKEHAEKMWHEEKRVVIHKGKNSVAFSVFGSSEAVAEIMTRFYKKQEKRISSQQNTESNIPWDPLPDSKRTGTYDDEPPF